MSNFLNRTTKINEHGRQRKEIERVLFTPQSVFRNCKLRMGPKPLGPGTDAPKRSFRGAYDGDALPPPLSDGPDRCPVAAPGAAAHAQYRARPPHHAGPARDRQCAAVPQAGRLRLAVAAPRLPELDDGPLLLRPMDPRRHLGSSQDRLAPAGAPPG